jgi:hypothetical protein
MRTVLIGSDFVRDQNGTIRPIEINTNVGYDLVKAELDADVFNLTGLQTFITSNGFTKVTYIGSIDIFAKTMRDFCVENSLEWTPLITQTGTITIPYVEDADDHLIIRSAYDTTALVDDTYCRDKIEFMNLIKDSEFSSQFAYIDNTNTLVNNITTIVDNGNHPNFILKSRYPNYNKSDFPKLYKIQNQQELDNLLSNLVQDTFVMPYYYNSNFNHLGLTTVVRTLHILYPPTLSSIPIAEYTKLASLTDDGNDIFDSTTKELQHSDRRKYLTNTVDVIEPHLLDTDMVELADGTFKTALDLQVGDLLKTIELPKVTTDGIDFNYTTDIDLIISGTTYTTNAVVNKERINKLTYITRLTFTDQTTWFDTYQSSYLVKRGTETAFRALENNEQSGVIVGDSVLLIDTTTTDKPSFVFKEIATISSEREVFGGWVIQVENDHIFLTVTDPSTTNIQFAAIEHNVGCNPVYGGCREQGTCPKNYQCCPRNINCQLGVCATSCSGTYNRGACC